MTTASTLGLGRVRAAQQVRHPTHPSLSQRCLHGKCQRIWSSSSAQRCSHRRKWRQSFRCCNGRCSKRNCIQKSKRLKCWSHQTQETEREARQLSPWWRLSWRIFRFTTAKTCLWTRSGSMDLRVSSTFFTCHGTPRVTPTRLGLCELHPSRWCSTISEGHRGGSTLTKNTRRAACPFGLNVQMSRASSPTEPASPKNPTLVHGCCPQSQWCHCWRLENGVEFPDAARKAKLSPWWKPRLSAGPYAAAEDPPSAFVVWLMSLSAASEAPDIVLKHIRVCAGWQIWQEMSWYHHVTRRCEPDWPVSLSAHRRGESLNADYAVPMEHFLSNPPPAIAEKKG